MDSIEFILSALYLGRDMSTFNGTAFGTSGMGHSDRRVEKIR